MGLYETATLLYSSARDVSPLQITVKDVFPCLQLPLFPSSEKSTSQGQEDGLIDDAKEQKRVRRVRKITIFAAEVVSILLASIISFTILVHTQESMELYYR